MAVRQDQVQLNIAFLTDESRAFARLVQENKAFIADLQKAQKEGKSLDGIIQQMAESGKKVENLDLTKLAPAQLIERARQLQQAIRLIPQSSPEFRQLQGELGRVNGQLRQINDTAKGIGNVKGGGLLQNILGVAGGVGLVDLVKNAIGSLFNFGKQAVAEVDAQLKADAQIKEAIRSTGGVAGKSLEELKAQAEELQKVTLFGDEQTEGAQALLLTFKNIRGEIFDQTVPIVQDLATAFKQDLSSSAIQVGKALEDPIKGVTALRRVGITFSEDQRTMIKSLVETGRVADAQRIILKELESQVGGSARAAAQAGAGPWQQLTLIFGEVKEAIGGILLNITGGFLPAIRSMTDALLDFLSVPVSETLEKERQGFNGVAVSVLNAEVGTKARTEAIKKLQQQYPQFLSNIDAERVTNDQLKPILDKINQSYVIRIALQKQQEKLAPLLEAQAEQENRLAEGRAASNRLLARGAELAGVNLQQFQTQAEQTAAVIAGLNKSAQFREGVGFSQPLNEQAKVLQQIQQTSSQIDATTVRQQFATKQATEAEKQRQEVVEELRKTYGALVDESFGFEGKAGVRRAADRPHIPSPAGKLKKETEAAQGSLAFLRQQIADLQKEIENTPGDSQALKPLLEQLRVAEEALKVLEDRLANLKSPKADAPPSDDEIARQLGIPTAEKLGELTDEQRVAITELSDFRIEEEARTTEELNALRQGLSDEDALRRQQEREAEEEHQEGLRNLKISAAETVANAYGEITRNRIQQETDEALGALDKEYQAKINAAAGNSSEQQRLQKELEKKKEGIERDAAAKRKALALKEAIIAGALAVVKALPNPFAAAAAGIAAAAQIVIISTQKFERGTLRDFSGKKAKSGFFGGQPHSAGGTKGYFDDGTTVEVEKDEYWAVVNKKNAPMLRALSWVNSLGGNGVPFFQKGGTMKFATGGLPTVNTTPTSLPPVQTQTTASLANMDMFIAAVQQFTATVAAFPTEVKSRVVVTELETAQAELDGVRADAAI